MTVSQNIREFGLTLSGQIKTVLVICKYGKCDLALLCESIKLLEKKRTSLWNPMKSLIHWNWSWIFEIISPGAEKDKNWKSLNISKIGQVLKHR